MEKTAGPVFCLSRAMIFFLLGSKRTASGNNKGETTTNIKGK